MDIKKLQALVIDALEDVKAQDIRAYDTVHLTSLFDRLTIASGTSNRQTRALAASVRDKVKEHGGSIVSIEGEDTGEWVLVDLGEIVVHIMQPAIRDYYRLEEIWGDKEIKLGAAKRGASRRHAEEAGEKPAARKVSRHLTVNQTATDDDQPKRRAPRKTAGSESATKTATKAARKTPAKTAAKKGTGTPTGKTVKVAAPKVAAAKKAPAKRAPAKQAPAKRAPARKKAAAE